MNGAIPLTRLSHSVPESPVEDKLNAAGVIGSAESLVGRVCLHYNIKYQMLCEKSMSKRKRSSIFY